MDKLGPLGTAYSSQVIGAVVDALGLNRGVLRSRTARRFFDGRAVSEDKRTEILRELGEILIERELVPVPPAFREYDISMVAIIAEAVTRAALLWDNLLATIQSRSGAIEHPGLAIEQFLRFVVVDLALRAFALLRLSGLQPPRPATPLWAEPNGGGKLLRRLTERGGLTRERLASCLNVSDTAVDNWLDGKNRPTPENIVAIAEVLARCTRDATAKQLELEIHRHFTLAHIADLLVPWIGRGQVIDLSASLVRFIWIITRDVKDMDREPIEVAAGVELTALRFGSEHPLTHTLLRNLALTEADVNWKEYILAAAINWDIAFQFIATRSIERRFAAGLAQDVSDVFRDGSFQDHPVQSPAQSDPAEEALQQLATAAEEEYQRMVLGEVRSPVLILDAGIELRRAIVRDFPLSPRAHYELGSFLGMAGQNLRRRDLVDEGIVECKISVALLPNWDGAAVEPGIILADIGEFAEALQELDRAKEGLTEATPHLQLCMGYVLMNLSRYEEALEELEEVVAAQPDHALALMYAARCAFRLSDKTKGIKYAKAARRLGEPDEYVAWRRGDYSS